jgi:hypothetical protein
MELDGGRGSARDWNWQPPALASAGLTIVGEDLARPWGGFLLISQTDIREFIRVYFPNGGPESAGAPATLSPNILLVAPGRRLSWQYHRRLSEVWRIVEGPVGISRGFGDEETPMRSYGAREVGWGRGPALSPQRGLKTSALRRVSSRWRT